jgi:hypothetical protein
MYISNCTIGIHGIIEQLHNAWTIEIEDCIDFPRIKSYRYYYNVWSYISKCAEIYAILINNKYTYYLVVHCTGKSNKCEL